MARPIIIEEDVVEYLAKASVERRWRILSRVAMATATSEDPAPASSSSPPPAPERPSTAPPVSERRLLELTPPPPAPPPASTSPVDRSEELFRAMHELTLCESAPAGAGCCLEAALRAVPCLAGLVHLRDPATGDLTVVHAQGPRADRLLRTRTRADALMARAARAGAPTVVTYGAEPGAEKAMCPRHALFDPWSVVLVPVMQGPELLGLLEMIDPLDGHPFDAHAQRALAYVAARLGRFLADHGSGAGESAR